MDAYIYCGDLYCEACAIKIRAGLKPADDSNLWPCGPYEDGGGAADAPQHCGGCGVFLENPLSADGEDYVCEAIREDAERVAMMAARGERVAPSATVAEWAELYSRRGYDSIMEALEDAPPPAFIDAAQLMLF